MKNTKILLNDILRLKKDFEAQNIDMPTCLVGIYGEILVFHRLQKLFRRKSIAINYFSGHKGVDIQIIRDKDLINIEVKTSRLKEEGYGLWYGAALNIKKCKLKEHAKKFIQHPKRGKVEGDFCYFDVIVFVALDSSFLKPKYYIIPRDFIVENCQLLRNEHKRFSNSTHRIIISNNGHMPNLPIAQRALIRKTETFRNKWAVIYGYMDKRLRLKGIR